MQPLRLLFITSLVPSHGSMTGYEVANAAIIHGLLRAGADVTIVGFNWPERKASMPDKTIVLGEVDVRTQDAGFKQKIKWILKAIRTNLTVSSVKLRVISDQVLRDAIASAGEFDAYILNGVAFAGAFEHVFEDKPSIFIAHNVEHRSAEENANAVKDLLQKILFKREAKLLAKLEKRLCDQAKFVFTLADEDGKMLGLQPIKFATLPLVTSKEPVKPVTRELHYDLALIGTWTWQPNRIGLEWFLREVKPLLNPDIKIAVAGSTPADLIVAWPDIEFLGRVPDAVAFVESAAVIPLISVAGTGVQLKTIETFELGMPCVATRHSVRGIAQIPDNCILADEPAAFAAALEVQVKHARNGERCQLDGEAFYYQQLTAMDQAIKQGLAVL
ncbi:glycosyltransferase [Paenochrobactrum pullorum]|uniref:glycosyltransferase n=1 Tax=Paenochrobactrum pullorum TaxID=1324351 RepID=UPI0035BBCEDE